MTPRLTQLPKTKIYITWPSRRPNARDHDTSRHHGSNVSIPKSDHETGESRHVKTLGPSAASFPCTKPATKFCRSLPVTSLLHEIHPQITTPFPSFSCHLPCISMPQAPTFRRVPGSWPVPRSDNSCRGPTGRSSHQGASRLGL